LPWQINKKIKDAARVDCYFLKKAKAGVKTEKEVKEYKVYPAGG